MENSMGMEPEELIAVLKKINEQQNSRIREQEQTIADLRATIAELRTTVANLNETLDEFRRKFFGKSSEKTAKPESDAEEQETADSVSDVKAHTRKRKSKSAREELYASRQGDRV